MSDVVCPDDLLDEAIAVMERFEKAPLRGLALPELKLLLRKLGRLSSCQAAAVCRVTAEVEAAGPAAGAAGVLQKTTKMSKREANRVARTARGLQELPSVAERLASGEITAGHAGVLVDTARETGPAAVNNNTGLLDRAAEIPEDLFAEEAKRFANQESDDRGEELLRRQRRKRRASLWKDAHTGMGRLNADLDPVTFGLVRHSLEEHAKALRRADASGAEGSDPTRSGPQRLADALTERLTGLHALTGRPLSAEDCSGAANGTVGAEHGHRGVAPQLVIVADLGLIDGTDPNGRCEIPGTGPVPPSILERLSPDAKLAGLIFGGDGRPLWLGRSRRRTSVGQYLAVAVRDRGCVQCSAPMHQCEIHHVVPWEQGGGTDIDNLQALCSQHHRQHHGPHDPAKRRPGLKNRRAGPRNRRVDPSSRESAPVMRGAGIEGRWPEMEGHAPDVEGRGLDTEGRGPDGHKKAGSHQSARLRQSSPKTSRGDPEPMSLL